MATQATPVPTPGSDEKPINPKLLIPKNDGALAEVGRLVKESWSQEAWFLLRWKTQVDFAQLVTTFTSNITEKRAATANRTPQTQRLQELDDEMDQALRILKSYVLEEAKYNKAAAEAQLPGFGLIRPKSGGYWLIDDRDQRLKALQELLLPAVTAAPFAGREFGKNFWQVRIAEYAELLRQADGLSGTVTKSVSKKDEAKKELRKVLQAIIYALRANFPDTYEAELRAWGFRKVSY
jgi:hypothetical protein